MKFASSLALGATSLATSAAHAVDYNLDLAPAPVRRAFPADPSGYTPITTDCPSDRPTVRFANGLSTQESNWLRSRRNQTLQPMSDFLSRAAIPNFDAASYLSTHAGNASNLPNVAIAASGGGYRALMNGAGAIAAFDSRTFNSTAKGQLGGLLQSATYLAGLSGGSWLVGSLYANNFTSVQDIIDTNGQVWAFEDSIFKGPSQGIAGISELSYYHDIEDEVDGKRDAPLNFNITITDYWGRALSFQLVGADDGGPGYTMSSIASQEFFTNGSVPLPILVSDGRAPGEVLIPANTTIYEFSPWELGSWDPTVYGFAPLQYTGSNFTGGQISEDQQCVIGFDNIGYVMGTSSTLFNEFLLEFNDTAGGSLPSFLTSAIMDVLADIGFDSNDIADWTPNPFYGFNNATNLNAHSTQLTLVDGGEDNQNIPLHPLLQPVREVDVIFAIDSSADTNYNWPNGSSLVQTYERTRNAAMENGTAFPYIPDTQTFINLGLNNRPTFFGCNASNSTNANVASFPSPLIVYLPNSPYSYDSNVSTFDPSYNASQRDAIIQNGYDVATRANSSGDAQWPVCVACAVIQRSLLRTNTAIPAACATCFSNYCWNGDLNTTANSYNPTLRLPSSTSGAVGVVPGAAAVLAAGLAAALWMVI